MGYTTIEVAHGERGDVRITLNRPGRRNAFNDTMLQELEDCTRRINADTSVKVVTLAGAGGDFCSGRDLSELSGVGKRDSSRPVPAAGGHESSMFRALEMPTVALLDGVVVGGGLGFALQCDLRIATDRVRVFDGHLRGGMAPSVAAWYLPRLTSVGNALRLCASAGPLDPQDVREMGIVDVMVDLSEVEAEHARVIEPFLLADARLLRHTKALLRGAQTEAYDQTMRQVGLFRAVERLS